MDLKTARYEDVRLGWVCAIQRELDTARAALEEEFRLPYTTSVLERSTSYVVGRIQHYLIVIVCLYNARNAGAATLTGERLRQAFPSLQLALLVGIGGGVRYWGHDIKLGDVVVSQPDNGSGGVVSWDSGKYGETGFSYRGHYRAPADRLLAAANELESRRRQRRFGFKDHFIAVMVKLNEQLDPQIQWPSQALHRSSSPRQTVVYHSSDSAGSYANLVRPSAHSAAPPETAPSIHRGIIASGNSVMGNAVERDGHVRNIYEKLDVKVLCFEMEAADIMNTLPCLVVRGICDFADEHKTDKWQEYAALTAATYARMLISTIEPEPGPENRVREPDTRTSQSRQNRAPMAEQSSGQRSSNERGLCTQADSDRYLRYREANGLSIEAALLLSESLPTPPEFPQALDRIAWRRCQSSMENWIVRSSSLHARLMAYWVRVQIPAASLQDFVGNVDVWIHCMPEIDEQWRMWRLINEFHEIHFDVFRRYGEIMRKANAMGLAKKGFLSPPPPPPPPMPFQLPIRLRGASPSMP